MRAKLLSPVDRDTSYHLPQGFGRHNCLHYQGNSRYDHEIESVGRVVPARAFAKAS